MCINKNIKRLFNILLLLVTFAVIIFYGQAKAIDYTTPNFTTTFPDYAKNDGTSTNTDDLVLENEYTKITFRKRKNDSGYNYIQNEIRMKSDGNYQTVKEYSDGLGYLSLYTDSSNDVSYQNTKLSSDDYEDYESLLQFTYNYNGTNYQTTDPYKAGYPSWIIPSNMTLDASGNIIITGYNDYVSMKATWQLNANDKEPKVDIQFTIKQKGEYSFGIFYSQNAKTQDEVKFIQVPFRYQEKNFPTSPTMVTEAFSTSGITQMTTNTGNKITGKDVTYGLVVDPTSQEYRWVYNQIKSYNNVNVMNENEQSNYGLMITDSNSNVNPAIFAPIIGSSDSNLDQNEIYTISYRPITNISTPSNDSWYESYSDILTRILKTTDYRNNYFASVTDTIFNIQDLLLNDFYSGWDKDAKANYNIEGKNVVSNFDGLAYLQLYLLSENETLYHNRTIPSLEYILSRNVSFAYDEIDPDAGVTKCKENSCRLKAYSGLGAAFGRGNYLTSTYAGAYLMTFGRTPIFGTIVSGETKSQSLDGTGSNSIWDPTDFLWKYKVTGNKSFLNRAKIEADKYIEKRINNANIEFINSQPFVNAKYYPNVYAMLEMYEATGEQKYLDAANTAVKRMLATMWAGPMPPLGNSTLYLNVNEIKANILNMGHQHTYYHGSSRYRLGITETCNNGTCINSIKDGVTLQDGGTFPTWVTSRVGLGVEQASTFKHQKSANIYLSTWAGELMRLSSYINDDLYQIFARNSIIGRYANYPGYYVNDFHTYSSLANYPTTGVDGTFIFYHHIPVMISVLQDYLFQQAYAWSNKNVAFPYTKSTNAQTWFNTRHYGYQSGSVYDEDEMWLWLKKGLVTTDSQQIDWFAARKNNKVAFIYMNESDSDITTTLTYNTSLLINSSKKAYLYEQNEDGTYTKKQISINDNGEHQVTIKAKSMVTVITEANVSKPNYVSDNVNYTYDTTSGYEQAAMGTNILTDNECIEGEICDVNAFIIQLKKDSYYAYIYTDKKPQTIDADNGIQKMIVRYSTDGKNYTSVTDETYPFEFDLEVTDINSDFKYKVEFIKDGKNYGSDSSYKTLSVSSINMDTDNTLKNLSITGCTISFDSSTTSYNCIVPNTLDKVTISAEANSNKSIVSGTGIKELQSGENNISIIVTSESGSIKIYNINIIRMYIDEVLLETKNASYTGSAITANKATSTSNTSITYTYYSTTDCSGNQLSNIPVNAGNYSVKAVSTGNEIYESGSICVTHTITKGTPIINLVAKTSEATGDSILANEATAVNPNGSNVILNYNYNYYSDSSCKVILSGIPSNVGNYYVKATSQPTNNLNSANSDCVSHTITNNTDATLNDLSIEDYNILPEFTPSVIKYDLTVENNVTSIKILAVSNSKLANISGIGIKSLTVGENEFKIIVTAQSGDIKIYTITVTRKASSDATLKGLTVSSGTLSPVFSSGTTSYTLAVPYSVTSLTVTPTVNNSEAKTSVTGNTSLTVGTNTISIVVTAGDGTKKTYTITVTRSKDTTNTLKSLSLSNCTLSPTFASGTTSYTCTVENSVTSTTVTATATSSVATVSGTGSKSLSVGSNTISVIVTSQSGAKKTYTVTVTRKANNDATLKSLGVTGKTITPAFNKDVLIYTLEVPYSVDSITITGEANVNTSNVEGLGSKVLKVGENSFDIVVTAEDKTIKTYNITVTRKEDSDTSLKSIGVKGYDIVKVDDNNYTLTVANNVTSVEIEAKALSNVASISGTGVKSLKVRENRFEVIVTTQNGDISIYNVIITRKASSDATLKGLTVSSGTLSPTFASGTTSYTLTVPYSVTSLTVTPTVNNSEAKASVTGNTSLTVGSNTVSIIVTAGDGTKKTYTITVTRSKDTTNTLKSLSLSNCTLSPTFASGTTSYTCTVENSVTSTTVTATATSSVATVSGTGSKSLSVGSNTVSIVVTSQSGAKKTYTVTVTRKANSDATLKSLGVTGKTITPAFNKDVLIYTLEVPYSVDSITITGEANVNTSNVEGLGSKVLKVGENSFDIVVTAEDKTTKTYNITVTRKEDSDTSLKSIGVKGYDIVKVDDDNYTLTVENNVTSVEIVAEALSSVASVSGTGVKSLIVGENKFGVIVTAKNGNISTYNIVIIRKPSSDATLKSLSVSSGTLSPTFASNITNYKLTVENSVTSLTVTPIVNNSEAKASVTGNTSLTVGSNTVSIVVTAGDGTKKTYTITVTRKEISNYIPGDVNNDGKFSVTDIIALRRYLASLISDINVDNSDANRDGKVTLTDLIILRKRLAGLGG